MTRLGLLVSHILHIVGLIIYGLHKLFSLGVLDRMQLVSGPYVIFVVNTLHIAVTNVSYDKA